MTGKTIKVFLASSDELRIDRLEFGDFINRLNNIYRNRGIYIELLKWEGFDASMSAARKQSDYNKVVRGSDMFLALFHTKAGAFTLEEFQTALDEFSKSKEKPRIFTYFKELENGQTEEAALAEFKKKLINEMGHYYCRYGNPDTMLLHFVLQIKVLNLDTAPEVKVEQSKITIDGQKVIDLTKIPFLNRNKDYMKLKNQLADLEGKYLTALERSRRYPDDPSFLAEMIRISEAKENLKKNLDNLEKSIVGFAEKLLELSARSVSSARLRKAQAYFETGDIAGANAVLDYDEISEDIDRAADSIDRKLALMEKTGALVEADKKQLKVYVDELLMKAEALQLELSNPNRFAEAKACYAKAADIAEKYRLGITALFKYERYLYRQNDFQGAHQQCLRCYRRAKEDAEQNPVFLPNMALAQNSLGLLYKNTGRLKEAEGMYLAALETRKALAEKNPAVFLTDMAATQNSLGLLYQKTGRMKEAEAHLLAALEMRKALAGKNPAALSNLAMSQSNLGALYSDTGRMKEAEEMFTSALKTYQALAEKNPAAYLTHLAMMQNNLGYFYTNTGRTKEAEKMHTAALETYRALAEQNPSAYLPGLAVIENNLGILYYNTGRMKQAEEMYTAALKTRRALAEQNPAAYLPNVALTQNNLGILYHKTCRLKEAEEMYTAALEIYDSLSRTAPETYKRHYNGVKQSLESLRTKSIK